MKDETFQRLLKGLYNYIFFFCLVGFAATCCMMLFMSTLITTLEIELTAENIATAAKLTFLNVLLLSFIYSIIDAFRRKWTVKRATKRIMDATEKIMQGDFSIRIEPLNKFGTDESFNQIIHCFNKMATELNSVETLRTDFIANVSHEMKTPLAVMKNYGTLLQAPSLSDELRIEYAKGITDSSHRMADMMTNILKLNRLENQQIFPQTTEFDLGEQLCECLLQFENIWEKENIEIDTEIEENVKVKADAELLSLVWNNLFSNAFKFTKPNGKVSLQLFTDEQFAYVKVSDTGCGMTPEIGAHIFEKFYQGDTSHSVQGNGLGLALVKRVIDILHGEIMVESRVDEGSTFTVKIRKC